MEPEQRAAFRSGLRRDAASVARQELATAPEPPSGPEQWWCECGDRESPHVHMPNWGADSRYGMLLTALVDVETGLEIPGSRK